MISFSQATASIKQALIKNTTHLRRQVSSVPLVTDTSGVKHEFLLKSSLGLAIVSLFLLTPFSINNFMQSRYLLGAGSLVLVIVFFVNFLTITQRNKYFMWPSVFTLVPAMTLFLVTCLQQQGMIGIFWSYPAIVSLYFMFDEKVAWLANAVLLAFILPQAQALLDIELLVRAAATLVMISCFSAIFVRVITAQQTKLRAQAVTDPLTGLLNWVLLHSTLERAVQQNQRSDIPMTLLTLDVDHFKRINDTYGHDAGDKVLVGLSQLLKTRIRLTDCIFRLGGEEFLVLLYNTDNRDGQKVAEELRSAVSESALLADRVVTVSIGIAPLDSCNDWDVWMHQSDEALYLAKTNGRNRVEMWRAVTA